jgi:hypothetical protein
MLAGETASAAKAKTSILSNFAFPAHLSEALEL